MAPLRRRLFRTIRASVLAGNVSLAAIIALVFLIAGSAVVSLRNAGREAETSLELVAASEAVLRTQLDLETGVRGFGLTRREDLLEPWRAARVRFPSETALLVRLTANDPARRAVSRDVAERVREYALLFSPRVIAATRAGGTARAARLARTGAGKRRTDAIRVRLQRLERGVRSEARARRDRADARRTTAIAALGLGLLACVAVIVIRQRVIDRRVLIPVGSLRQTAERLRRGELGARVDPQGDDEVADLGHAFDDMAESLQVSDADLRRSNTELEQFAYVASHDLAEPLRVMAGYSDLLRRKYAGELDERAEGYIKGIKDGSERMRALIDDLLAYSRAGRRELDIEDVDLNRVVRVVLQDLAAAVADTGARVEVGRLPTVRADQTQMRTVFQNLIANAIKFRRPGEVPRVTVSATDGDGTGNGRADPWRLTVTDNGIGIDPRYAERVFRMFQRLHTREEYAGTGIGLALAQRVIERHGGVIWVGNPEGPGSVFHFTLPKEGPPVSAVARSG